jgi:orotate phosphoribosyltransferase
MIGEALVPLIPSEATVRAGLEMGGIPIVTMLGQLTGLPERG